jgi:putative hemolysin
MNLQFDRFTLKIAKTDAERLAAQQLRYDVFVTEMGANVRSEPMPYGVETDAYDVFSSHLILTDTHLNDGEGAVIGTCRILNSAASRSGVGYYTSTEFDLSDLLNKKRSVVELGRLCVAHEHRGGLALYHLWKGVEQYVNENQVNVLIGTASFSGTDVTKIQNALGFLNDQYLAKGSMCVSAVGDRAIPYPTGAYDRLKAVAELPSIIKSYLRMGCLVGRDAVIDYEFNTIDVCMLLDVASLRERQQNATSRTRAA